MIVKLDLLTTLLMAGIMTGSYQTIALLLKKKDQHANRFIAISSLLVTVILSQYFLVLSGGYASFPHLLGVAQVIIVALGPTLFFFTKAAVKKHLMKVTEIIHYVPTFLLLYFNFQIVSAPFDLKVALIDQQWSGVIYFSWYYFIFLSLLVIQMSTYLFLIHKMIRSSYQSLIQQQSNTVMIRLKWMQMMLKLFILFMVFFLVAYSVWSLQYTYSAMIEGFIMLMMAGFIFSISYYSLKGETSFNDKEEEGESVKSAEKYKNSPLTDDSTAENLALLITYMKSNKPYLNHELKLQDLSECLSLPRHHLSQIINQEVGLNFFDFVNQYRVEEAKQKLTDDKFSHLSIHGIGLESGFSNKVSFNRIFKKFTQLTPTGYIKQQKLAKMSNTL